MYDMAADTWLITKSKWTKILKYFLFHPTCEKPNITGHHTAHKK